MGLFGKKSGSDDDDFTVEDVERIGRQVFKDRGKGGEDELLIHKGKQLGILKSEPATPVPSKTNEDILDVLEDWRKPRDQR